MTNPAAPPRVSVVVPVKDEAANVHGLLVEICAALEHFCDFEVIFVDDGSTDGTGEVLTKAATDFPRLRLLRHAQCCGQSAAIRAGVYAARGEIIATLDGDGQNPPAELPRLIAPLLVPDISLCPGLVAGQRLRRADRPAKKLASQFANWLRASLLKDETRDTGCGLKAFRRATYLELPYFDHIHRFMPALMRREGHKIRFVDVGHRPRIAGRSKYGNIDRALVGIVDLVGVYWLIRRRRHAGRVYEPPLPLQSQELQGARSKGTGRGDLRL